MLSANQKRNMKTRAYRQRKEFKDLIHNLPPELLNLILEYKPIPEELVIEEQILFLEKKYTQIKQGLKKTDPKKIYNLCTIGPVSEKVKTHPTILYYMRFQPYNKYDTFSYIPEDYDFWKKHMASYYIHFSNNKRIHREFNEVILCFIKKEMTQKFKENEFGALRKQLLAIQASIV
jgi:hypothetical protein